MTLPAAALQRVVVRLLHDPALVDHVYAGRELPEIGPTEHRWIRSVDRRAWGVDPYRRSRLLHALIEEFPVAVAARGTEGLESFCSSAAFHTCIQDRGHLAAAFGRWLGEGGFARLERTFAAIRRGAVGGLGPGVGVVAVPAGCLDAWSAARARLGADPVPAVVGGARAVEPVGGLEYVCVEQGSRAGHVPVDLFRVLEAAAAGRDPVRAARDRGASRAEAGRLVAELRAEGLIAPAGTRSAADRGEW